MELEVKHKIAEIEMMIVSQMRKQYAELHRRWIQTFIT